MRTGQFGSTLSLQAVLSLLRRTDQIRSQAEGKERKGLASIAGSAPAGFSFADGKLDTNR